MFGCDGPNGPEARPARITVGFRLGCEPGLEGIVQRSLEFVTSVAARLMEATASSAAQVSEQVLADLVERLEFDAGFLRYNDHNIRASKLIAEWPPRPKGPDSDPLSIVHFSNADAVLALSSHLKEPAAIRPEPEDSTYLQHVGAGHRVSSPLVAVAPLLSGEVTTGILGAVKFRGRTWKAEHANTLNAVASLFAQLQARIAAEDKLRHLAEHDDLTGLLNRRALIAALSDRLGAGRPGPVGVLYVDLDRLKRINDYLGHTAGDWYIRDFAQQLRAEAGQSSVIARIGGDEFVILPNHTMSVDAAESFAERLRTTLRERVQIAGRTITRTVSVGVAVGLPGRDNSADLLHRADEAVLAAKRAGGNQVAKSTDGMSLKRLLHNDMDEVDLTDDFDSNSLLLHYLPEVDLWTGAIVAVEALVRLQHPTRGLLLPGSFIGAAESANLAAELGRWVLRNACTRLSQWRSDGVGQNAILRINVSPVQLNGRGFVRSVANTIEEFGVDAGSVCLEITERAVVHDMENTRRILTELKEVGVQIAIDDFGTGYAVLSHLKSLPVDILKIDKVFVRDLGTNPSDLAIVRAIIGLADAFGLQVIAEGVETPVAALTLMRHGCHRAQGFLLSRPVSADTMESLLSTRWMPMPYLANSEALTTHGI
jgi:diguanylate cyclase (GGDEF)-like protein